MGTEVITRDYIRSFFRLSNSEQDSDLLDEIMSGLRLKEYDHNSYICRIGDEANEMFFIESGIIVVRGKDGEVSNELHAGKYFGEYAAITGDKRMADIQAQGTVLVYILDKETLLNITKKNANIYGIFLKNVYAQSTEKYRALIKTLNSRRGLGASSSKKKVPLKTLIVNYSCVLLFFAFALIFAPDPAAGNMHPFWLCSPILFMVAYLVITKRALESLLISTIYIMLLLSRFNFIGKLNEYKLYATSGVADIIIIILLMGSLTRLFAASGSINALRDIVHSKIKSAKGTLFSSFFSMILIALDEYLSVMINSACFTHQLDKYKVPREKAAIVMGLTPSALCLLSPFSIIGIYIAGVVTMYTEQSGVFLHAIRYNFGSFFFVFFVILLIIGKLPLVGALKQAHIRVKEGGSLWPEGTDTHETEEQARGRLVNLFLPVLVFIVSSIVAGTISMGFFSVNVLYGMCITLIFVFFLYVFQQYMTPEQFFDNLILGIENMIGPVVVFIIGKCFAYGLADLGFKYWLNDIVNVLIQDQLWLLPSIIFAVCTLIAALFNDHWAVYAFCIPIAAGIAESFSGNTALFISAVCSAGFLGSEIAPGHAHFIGEMLGVNEKSYHLTKLPYVAVITGLTFCAYVAAGLLGLSV